MAIDQEFLKSIGLDSDDIMQKIATRSTEDEAGLVAKRDELLGKVTGYRDQLTAFDGIDPVEYRTAMEKLKEFDEKDLMNKGEFDTLRQRLIDDYEGKIDGKDGQITKLVSQLEGMLLDSQAAQAINDAGGNAKLLMPIIKARSTVVDNEGSMVVQIMGEDGKEAKDAKGDPLSFAGLLETMKADNAFSGAFNSSGLSGGGAPPSGGQGQGGSGNDGAFGASRMAAARKSS